MKHCLEHYMLISRALVKAFSEQLPNFICRTLDFRGTSRHYIRTSGIKSSIKHYFWGVRESIKQTVPEHYPLDPTRHPIFIFITCHMIVFMPLTNPRSPRAVHITRYTTLIGLIYYTIYHGIWPLNSIMYVYVHVKWFFHNFFHFLCACTCAGQPSHDM